MITVFAIIVALIVVLDLLITLRQIKDTLQRIEKMMRGALHDYCRSTTPKEAR
jgi:uncharacterized protein YoxC